MAMSVATGFVDMGAGRPRGETRKRACAGQTARRRGGWLRAPPFLYPGESLLLDRVLRVDGAARTFLAPALRRRLAATRSRARRLLVHRGRGLGELLVELLARGFDRRHVVGLERLLDALRGALDALPQPAVELVAIFLQSLAHLVQPLVRAVAALGRLAVLAIL